MGGEPEPPPDEPFVRDYSHWWTLPPDPPLPLALLAVVAAIIVLSLIAGVLGQDLKPKH